MIRKRRLQIDYALFWVLFSILLVLFAALPGVVGAIAELLGFESASNFVFLTIIFLLVLRLFSVTLKLSRLNQQITDLTQRLAILQKLGVGANGADDGGSDGGKGSTA
jgi:hypothetical protein